MPPTLAPLFTWRAALTGDGSPLSSMERLVGLVLSLHMSERGDSCFPGLDRLAREASVSKSTVAVALRELEAHGFLVRVRSAGGSGKTSRYFTNLPELSAHRTDSGETVRQAIQNCPPGGQEDVYRQTESSNEASVCDGNPKPKKPRPTDHVWEALTAHFGEPTNDAERARLNQAVKLTGQALRADGVDVKQDGEKVAVEVGRRCRAAFRTFERYGPVAIAANWNQLGKEEA